jgi:hypothetical protein
VATRRDQDCCKRKCRDMVNNKLQYERHTKPERQRQAKKVRRKKG